jgi:hypothetical protein
LRAKLSRAEENAIEQRPTADLRAYDLYLRAQAIELLVKDTAEEASVMQQKISLLSRARHNMKHWEIIADKLSKAGWSWGCVSAIDSEGRTIWIANAHRDDTKRFVVNAEES